jgi:HTH-type transcriptional regulator / antitoxin HigA
MMTVLDLSPPHVLRTSDEFDAAVAEIDRLLDLDPQPPTAEYDRLELLSVLVEDYESRHDPIDDSDLTPEQVLGFLREQQAGRDGAMNPGSSQG